MKKKTSILSLLALPIAVLTLVSACGGSGTTSRINRGNLNIFLRTVNWEHPREGETVCIDPEFIVSFDDGLELCNSSFDVSNVIMVRPIDGTSRDAVELNKSAPRTEFGSNRCTYRFTAREALKSNADYYMEVRKDGPFSNQILNNSVRFRSDDRVACLHGTRFDVNGDNALMGVSGAKLTETDIDDFGTTDADGDLIWNWESLGDFALVASVQWLKQNFLPFGVVGSNPLITIEFNKDVEQRSFDGIALFEINGDTGEILSFMDLTIGCGPLGNDRCVGYYQGQEDIVQVSVPGAGLTSGKTYVLIVSKAVRSLSGKRLYSSYFTVFSAR